MSYTPGNLMYRSRKRQESTRRAPVSHHIEKNKDGVQHFAYVFLHRAASTHAKTLLEHAHGCKEPNDMIHTLVLAGRMPLLHAWPQGPCILQAWPPKRIHSQPPLALISTGTPCSLLYCRELCSY